MRINLRPVLYAGKYGLVSQLLILLYELIDGFDQLLAELGQVLLFVHWEQALLVDVPVFRP